MEPRNLSGPKVFSELTVEVFDTIDQVEKEEWNQRLGGQGVYDWEGLKFLEEVFHGNPRKEHNWLFRYVVIKDTDGIPVLMRISIFLSCHTKDNRCLNRLQEVHTLIISAP